MTLKDSIDKLERIADGECTCDALADPAEWCAWCQATHCLDTLAEIAGETLESIKGKEP
jgi:hypothetical protein